MTRACCWLLTMMACAPGVLVGEVTIQPGELSISNRISYLMGDGRHPFVDDDARRALLNLDLISDASGSILGFDHLVIDQALTDAGESVTLSLPQTSGTVAEARLAGTGTRRRPAQAAPAPAGMTFAIGLPAAAKPYHGLSSVRGHLDLITADPATALWVVKLADLLQDHHPQPIGGVPQLTIGFLEAPEPGHLTLVLSPEARWALVAIDVLNADGSSAKIHTPRIDHRYPPHMQAGVDKIDTVSWITALPEHASLSLSYHPQLVHQPVAFALTAVNFGMQVPSATALLHGQVRGANDL